MLRIFYTDWIDGDDNESEKLIVRKNYLRNAFSQLKTETSSVFSLG